MSELIADIRNFLIAQNIDSSGNIFLSSLPISPDNIILLSKFNGSEQGEIQEAQIQLIVRNTSYSAAEVKINTIREFLDNDNPEQIVALKTNRTAVFSAIQSPRFLKEDEKRRKIFFCNFRVITDRD